MMIDEQEIQSRLRRQRSAQERADKKALEDKRVKKFLQGALRDTFKLEKRILVQKKNKKRSSKRKRTTTRAIANTQKKEDMVMDSPIWSYGFEENQQVLQYEFENKREYEEFKRKSRKNI